jgi:hypothetical protein
VAAMARLLKRATQATTSAALLGKRRPRTPFIAAPMRGKRISRKRIAFNVCLYVCISDPSM